MSKNLSALKKIKISIRNRTRNKMYKSTIKTLTKKYIKNLQNNNITDIFYHQSNLALVYKKIDKAVKKGILHKNNASRKKSILARVMKNYLNVS